MNFGRGNKSALFLRDILQLKLNFLQKAFANNYNYALKGCIVGWTSHRRIVDLSIEPYMRIIFIPQVN